MKAITFRVADDAYEQIVKVAAERHATVTDFARQSAIDAINGSRDIDRVVARIDEAKIEIIKYLDTLTME